MRKFSLLSDPLFLTPYSRFHSQKKNDNHTIAHLQLPPLFENGRNCAADGSFVDSNPRVESTDSWESLSSLYAFL